MQNLVLMVNQKKNFKALLKVLLIMLMNKFLFDLNNDKLKSVSKIRALGICD